jgi:uncharacterized damage-inducible protein DinB
LEKAALLDEAVLYAHPGYGHGSIHDLFFHSLATSHGWRVALETGQQPRRLKSAGFERLPAIHDAFAQEFAAWQALIDKATDEQIASPILLLTLRGDEARLVYWRVLQHLTLHFMQHHTEIAQLLTLQGQSPGDIDFLFYNG